MGRKLPDRSVSGFNMLGLKAATFAIVRPKPPMDAIAAHGTMIIAQNIKSPWKKSVQQTAR